jgi:hypothetical protein
MGPPLEFYREQLDSGRFPEKQAEKLAELRSRYADRHIDVVIFMATTPIEVLPGAPAVYIGNVPTELINSELKERNSVVVWIRNYPQKTIEVAQRLQPTARKVLVLSGSSGRDLV